MLNDKDLAELISRLDLITSALLHQDDVAHISIVGQPEDIVALEEHILEMNARKVLVTTGLDPWTAGILRRDRYITPRRRKRLSNKRRKLPVLYE